jgi:hypothetical protein
MRLAFKRVPFTDPELEPGTMLMSFSTKRIFAVTRQVDTLYHTRIIKDLTAGDNPQPAPKVGLNWRSSYSIITEVPTE